MKNSDTCMCYLHAEMLNVLTSLFFLSDSSNHNDQCLARPTYHAAKSKTGLFFLKNCATFRSINCISHFHDTRTYAVYIKRARPTYHAAKSKTGLFFLKNCATFRSINCISHFHMIHVLMLFTLSEQLCD